ncbi:hypothetical protein JW935_29190, partial [candidate division KSB1 bacterium]|nr:hypothetical protein [candidate division KSB1 bacterium]
TLTIGEILQRLRTHGVTILPQEKDIGISKIVDELLKQYSQAINSAFGNKSLLQVLSENNMLKAPGKQV